MKKHHYRQRGLAWVLACSLLAGTIPSVSHAGMISTGTLVASSQDSAATARVTAFLEREAVQRQMLDLGVDPAEVQDRLDALTPEELSDLEGQLQNLPAGGVFEVIGIVFVVLLILELTGVIDIFKKT